MARLTDDAARDLGIRIVSPDRPGIGGSSLQPNRQLSHWLPVVRQLVDHLGIGEFRVLGISGGATTFAKIILPGAPDSGGTAPGSASPADPENIDAATVRRRKPAGFCGV